MKEKCIWLNSKTLPHHLLLSTKSEKEAKGGYARGRDQSQEADSYQDRDSTDVSNKERCFHKSSNLILIEKDTCSCFFSRVVMYLFYKNDLEDREIAS